MKRVGLMILVAIGLVALAHDVLSAEVTSVNVVGFKKVTVPPGGKLLNVGMNFDAFNPTLEGVFGTNQLRRADDEGLNGDLILVWDKSGQLYKRFVQREDGQFYRTSNLNVPTNYPLRAGESIWIKSPSTSTETRDLTLAGEAVPDPAVTNHAVPGLTMLSYPFSSDVDIQTTTLAAGGNSSDEPDLADQILIWDDANQIYKRWALKDSDSKWHRTSSFNTPATNVPLAMGQAFWYRSRTNGITWIEANPYLQNLKNP